MHLSRKFFAVLIVFFLFLNLLPGPFLVTVNTLAAQSNQTAQSETRQKPVRIAVLNNFPPFSFEIRSRLMGFTIDYVRLISEKSGIKIQFVPGTWEENLGKFRRGEVDMITAISYTEERTAFTRYTSPYYLIPTVVYIREGSFKYKGVQDLKGKTVGIEAGVYYRQYLKKYPGIKIVEIADTNELLRKLAFGEIDAVITNINIGNYMIKKHMLENVILAGRIDIAGIEDEDLRIGVRKDLKALHNRIQSAMNHISPYEYKGLQDQWVGFTPEDMKEMLMPREQELINAHVQKHGGLRISFHKDWVPIEFSDEEGKHSGIVAEIFTKLFKVKDISILEHASGTCQQAVQDVRAGEADLIPAVVPTADLREKLAFTQSYLSLPLVLATRSSEFFVGSLDNLDNKQISFVNRGDIKDVLQNKYPGLDFVPASSVKVGLKRVSEREVFGFVGTIPEIAHGIQQHNLFNIKISGRLEEQIPICAAVRKGNEKLALVIDKILHSISLDEKKRIVNHWIALEMQQHVDYTIVWRIIGIALIAAVIVIIWIRKVQSYNARISKANKLLADKNKELEHLSVTNIMTGLYNRNKIDSEMAKEFKRTARYKRVFSIILLDIDWFKSVNDTFGHQAGDAVLKQVAERIQNRVRINDVAGRWGGEEFLIICPETPLTGAASLAESLREGIENFNFSVDRQITISAGVAESDGSDDLESLLRRADGRLYLAKEQGRNRVIDRE